MLAEFMEAHPDAAMIISDTAGLFRWANHRYFEFSGFSKSEVIKTALEVHQPNIYQYICSGSDNTFCTSVVRKDGEKIPVKAYHCELDSVFSGFRVVLLTED